MMRFILLLLVLVPQLAFADTGFTPPATDLSVIYLSNIFGVVDGVLHGSGSQIMGAMFGVFNSAVLAVGGVVITYVLSVSTLNTAHEGKVLGQKWSSMWIPIRSATGVALLLPKATGYSVIQIMVMWVVVQGAGAADAVAGAAVNYLARGGVLVQANPPPDTGVVLAAGNILKSEICMFGVQNSLTNHPPAGANSTTVIPSLAASLQVVGNTTGQTPPIYCNTSSIGGAFTPPGSCDSGATMNFPGNVIVNATVPTQLKGMCGKVSWSLAGDSGGGLGGTSTSIANPAGYGASDSRSIAIQQVILDLQPLAQSLANYLILPSGSAPVTGVTLSSLLSQAQYQLVFAAADYKGIMLPYLTQQSNAFRQAALNTIATNATKGWIVLGNYYFELTQLNNNNNQSDTNSNITTGTQTDPAGAGSTAWGLIYSADTSILNSPPSGIGNVGNNSNLSRTTMGASQCGMVPPYNSNLIDNFICLEKNNSAGPAGYYQNTYQGTSGATAAQIAQGLTSSTQVILTMVFGPIVGSIVGIVSYLAQLADAQTLNIDPIITVSALGASILNFVTAIWLTAIILFAGVAAVSVVPCLNSVGFGAIAALMWILPLFGTITVALFGAGALMAYYVPLIPFIFFVFGALGWMIAVIESMVAAPLVALGLAYPEGHEHFGKAEAAIMLLLNILMRPSLMVFGFFAGVILSHVGLWLLNEGYGHVWSTVVATNAALSPGLGLLWGLVAGLLIYVGFVLAILNRSFALIYEIPNKVMRWIGHHEQLGGGEQQAAEELKGGYTGGMRAVGETTQSVAAGIGKHDEEMMKAEQEKLDAKQQPEMGGNAKKSAPDV